MARAAAKRRQPVRHHDTGRRRHKDSGGQRFEDTLFFNRIRKRAKWVFIFLTVVFAGGFVLFGVGSSNLSGLSDIFNGVGGSGSTGQPSVSKSLKETQQHPKQAKGWHDLATAYDTAGDLANAISAWQTYTGLRPKDVEGWTQLATDYSTQFNSQTADAQAAQVAAQNAQTTNFGPPPNSKLAQSLASVPNPIVQQISTDANQRFTDALNVRQTTANQRVAAYQKVAQLQPNEPIDQLQLADAATDAGNTTVAVAAYKRFVQLAPDDNQAAYARQQIKTLQKQLASSSQG